MNVAAFLREEENADIAAIRRVNVAAFEGCYEANLVDRLRIAGDVVASLVAELNGAIVGHILFSRLSIKSDNRAVAGVALAPMAVTPKYQNLGIGTALADAGLRRCRCLGVEAAVVLGHRNYYPRFGFSVQLAKRLDAPYVGPNYMALELTPNVLQARCRVRYSEAFSDVS